MCDYSLQAQITKYDRDAVADDLNNLTEEIADEVTISSNLVDRDAAQRLSDVKAFISENKDIIAAQHSQMKSKVTDLEALIDANMKIEAADADYNQYMSSDDVQAVAQMIAELRAMSEKYRHLLITSGRAGRAPN